VPRVRLLTQCRRALRTRHYSRRTEDWYVVCLRRFVRFSRLRLPATRGEAEIARFPLR
jgi:hypothetical protein